jgi:DNA-binding CsgD family transcriptional regulator
VHSELTQYDLTARQMRILGLLAQGLTHREIANRLAISKRTARREVKQILLKILRSGKSRAQIVVRPGHQTLISAAPPEAAWVKFWSSPGLTAAVVVTLMWVVLLRFLHH